MLRSFFRLGAYRGIGFNLLTCTKRLQSGRQSGRRPVRILNDVEEADMMDPAAEKQRSGQKRAKEDVFRQSKLDGKYYIKSEIYQEPRQNTQELDGYKEKPVWIEEENDYKLSQYMVTVKSRTRRRKENITLLEGKRLISDALSANVKLKALFVSRRTDITTSSLPSYDFKLYWMPYKYFMKWSDVTTSSGLIAIIQIPSSKETAPDPNCLPLTVICDNIRDPGNMGAILRVLAAAGCKEIFVTQGCVDIWEPKVLRAAAGGHFRVPIEYDVRWDEIDSLLGDEEASVFLADSSNIDTNNAAEGSGTSSDSEEDTITSEENSITNVNDQNNVSTEEEDSVKKQTPTICDHEILQALPYYALKFKTEGRNILVISNESFGPSKEAVNFTSARQGVKLHIPLCGKVESLNVVSALSIIAFEMRRQAALC